MNGANSNTSGQSTFKLRFKPAGESALVSKAIREELERDGYVVVEVTNEGNVVISPTPPEDTTKVWWPSDVNGVPQGSPKVYNPNTGQWEAIDSNFTPYTPPDQRNGTFFTPAGGSTQTAGPFTALHGGTNYHITLTPTLFTGGVWQTPPVSFPNNFGYFIANKSNTLFTVQFYGIPTGGLSWEWQAREIVTP